MKYRNIGRKRWFNPNPKTMADIRENAISLIQEHKIDAVNYYNKYLIKACYSIIKYVINNKKSPGNLDETNLLITNDDNVKITIDKTYEFDLSDDEYNELERLYKSGQYSQFMYDLCVFPYTNRKKTHDMPNKTSKYACLMQNPITSYWMNKETPYTKDERNFFNTRIKELFDKDKEDEKSISEASVAAVPIANATAVPTVETTAVPTVETTAMPTAVPTAETTAVPTVETTAVPTVEATAVPTIEESRIPEETQSAGKKKTRTKRRSNANKKKKQTKRRQKRTRKNW